MVIIGIWTLRKSMDIAIIIAALIITYYSTCILNSESFFVWINGFRRYIPYLFVLPIIRYLWNDSERRVRFIRIFDKTLYYFLWLQFPCLSLQAILYGMGDLGGGSLGWFNSGIISQLIYVISFYLMIRSWDPKLGYIRNLGKNWILLILLFPSFMNETKISFIFLILYFIFLIPFDKNIGRSFLLVIPIVALLSGGAFWWYVTFVDLKGDVYRENFLNNYVMGADVNEMVFDYLDEDVNTDDVFESDYARGIKFMLLPTLLEKGKPFNEFWGYGIGQFKGGNGLEKTKFAKHYDWIFRGTQMEIFNIIIELGYIGGALLIIFWFYVFRFFKRVGKNNRNKRLQWWMGLNMLLMIIYSPSFDSLPFVIIVLTICFMSSRWKELPAFQKPYLFIPPKQNNSITTKTLLWKPS